MYIVSAALSLLLLLASSVAIGILKYRQRRALREQYENIPNHNDQHDNNENITNEAINEYD